MTNSVNMRFPHTGLYFFLRICYVIKMKEVNPMKKQELFDLLYQLASPIAMLLAGLVLVFCPDVATALVSRLLGWVITLVGIGFGIGAILDRDKSIRRGITAVGLVCIGGFLSANPLVLAAFVGKIIGLLIALRGIREVFLARSRGYGMVPAAITAAAGAFLILLPMTASRLLFSGCGIVILLAGIMMLLEKLRHRQLPPGRRDIIDV